MIIKKKWLNAVLLAIITLSIMEAVKIKTVNSFFLIRSRKSFRVNSGRREGNRLNEIKVKRGSVYKIVFKAKRRDAKRHLLESFQANSLEEAKQYFKQTVATHYQENVNRMYFFELYTGNWKPIIQVEYKKEEK